ncbi:unnamed protein product [Onchocerca flexuosa]|uniref:Uncharacterized protein n=1 Tax=Onchocerca flexuosa TaxID=387005 RepID=A0A183H1B4_9BILA|nr:unnamed protein product [Onchocerca flexuosa]
MAVDDDQKNWNKLLQENTPLNENKLTSWQVSQNIMREIRQEVTRQVLAELTINNSDESDESDGREVCTLNNFRNNEISIDESREELARIINQRERYVGNASSEESELFYSGEDWTFSEKINKSPRSVQPKWKKLQWCRRPKCNSNEFCGEFLKFDREIPCISENKGRIAISEDGNEKRNGEGMEEFITPPLYTIPGIELE